MPRAGAEPKPPWRRVPRAVRRRAEDALGAPVVRAARIWGGYAPSPTFRLQLQDGRRGFFKGTNAESNEFMVAALQKEERAYTRLGHLIGRWAPAYYGAFRQDDWHVLLLEDLGSARVPPWTTTQLRAATHGLAEFHASTLRQRLPRWLARTAHMRWATHWQEVHEKAGGLESVAALAGAREAEARIWLEREVPGLQVRAEALQRASRGGALLHMDTRSDNLRLLDGQLRLFDWPFVCVGPAELEAALFAQSVTVEGGPEPERVMAWYGDCAPVRERVLDACIAGIPAFFAARGRLPDIPGLPRVRRFQRQQFRATLQWAARRFGLAEPEWVQEVGES